MIGRGIVNWKEPTADRFVSPCPPPSPYQAEITECLIEEAVEIAQRGTKLLRFGIDEIQPGQELTNKARLSQEIGDLLGVLDFAIECGLVSPAVVHEAKRAKPAKLRKFLQHAPHEDVENRSGAIHAANNVDNREPRNGWAPGQYLGICGDCDTQFIGDKRAVRCAPCAYGDQK